MNWNEIETKWAAMTQRVRSGGLQPLNNPGAPQRKDAVPSGSFEGLGGGDAVRTAPATTE